MQPLLVWSIVLKKRVFYFFSPLEIFALFLHVFVSLKESNEVFKALDLVLLDVSLVLAVREYLSVYAKEAHSNDI